MRYIAALSVLIFSETLFCVLMIGTDQRVIGHTDMEGNIVKVSDITFFSFMFSLFIFPLVAGAYFLLHKKTPEAWKKLRASLPLTYIVPLIWVAGLMASFYQGFFGLTWMEIEFFTFYFLTIKGAFLGSAIFFLAYKAISIIVSNTPNKSSQPTPYRGD